MLELRERRVEQVIDLAEISVCHRDDFRSRHADDRFLRLIRFIVDLTDELLDDILQRDDAVCATVLVYYDGHVQPPRLEVTKQFSERERAGYDERLARE